MSTPQSTDSILMIRPNTFGFDEETARSNAFQHHPSESITYLRSQACKEFDQAVKTLKTCGINVIVFSDQTKTEKPDAVFPNNWVSTWPNGDILLYPMAAMSRRIERNPEVLTLLEQQFSIGRIIDLSEFEQTGAYLESTGVMIFDHLDKTVYACRSIRCDETLFKEHASQLGYDTFIFDAIDTQGTPIYHTNVLMGIQSTTAIVCFDAIPNENQRATLAARLHQTGRTVISITHSQMASFCGNVLEVCNPQGETFLIMSETAHAAFTTEEKQALSYDKTIVPLAIPTIERVGGGSARCMLAEIFLPRRVS